MYDVKKERIAKRLARSGISSRREAEIIIASGRVSINGQIIRTPVFNVSNEDKIKVDGKQISNLQKIRLWLYHKPPGLITTNYDPYGRPTIFENLPNNIPRIISIGRLDFNTEGLLLLTNNGDLAHVLEMPSTGWYRKYRVRIHGKIDQKNIDNIKNGFFLNGLFYRAIDVYIEKKMNTNTWLMIILQEGKNREIKKIFSKFGLYVTRLIRISFGPFKLGNLTKGMIYEINTDILRKKIGYKLIEKENIIFQDISNINDNFKTVKNLYNKNKKNYNYYNKQLSNDRNKIRNKSLNVWMGFRAKPKNKKLKKHK